MNTRIPSRILPLALAVLIYVTYSPVVLTRPAGAFDDWPEDAKQMALKSVDSALAYPLIPFSAKLFDKMRQNDQNVFLFPLGTHLLMNELLYLNGSMLNETTELKVRDFLGYSTEGSELDISMDYYYYKIFTAERMDKTVTILDRILRHGPRKNELAQASGDNKHIHLSPEEQYLPSFYGRTLVIGDFSVTPDDGHACRCDGVCDVTSPGDNYPVLVVRTAGVKSVTLTRATAANHPDMYRDLADLEFRLIEIPLPFNLSLVYFQPLVNETGQELADLETQLLALGPDNMPTKFKRALDMIDSAKPSNEVVSVEIPIPKFSREAFKPESWLGHLKPYGLLDAFDFSKITNSTRSSRSKRIAQSSDGMINFGGSNGSVFSDRGPFYKIQCDWRPGTDIDVKFPRMFLVKYYNVPAFIGHSVFGY